MNKIVLILAIFEVLLNGFLVYGSPINSLTSKKKEINWLNGFNSDKLISFMQKYGYLEAPNSLQEGLQVEFLYAEKSIIDGIKNIQKFGGLEQTGIVDENTIKLMNSPRCGTKDIESHQKRRKRYIIGAQNWKKRQLTYFIANWSPKVGQNETYTAIENAFDAWSLYSRLVFKRIYDNTADIIIAFGTTYHGDRYPFDGPGNILAHAFYPYEENNFGGDVHFDDDENWKNGAKTPSEGFDFQSVAVHEIGHSLGLAHSFVYNAIMYPYYKGTTPPQLDYDDILGMYQLYISRPIEDNTDETENSTKSEISNENESDDEESEEKIESSTAKVEDEEFSIPDICNGNFDSAGLLNNFLLIIKDNFVWQFDKNFKISQDFPKKLSKVFPNLPKRFTKIDSFYQTPEDDEIVIFSGKEYITYDPRGPIYTAYNITRYTYDEDIEKIDTAMVWAKNNKTYLFSSNRYWRFSELRKMDFYYPRIIKTWRGIPANINGAVSFRNEGPTVFFKGDEYLLYDDVNVKPVEEYPRKIRNLLSNCN